MKLRELLPLQIRQLRLPAIGLTLAIAIPELSAATLTWDSDTARAAAQDGGGVWDSTVPNWWSGTANVPFSTTAPDAPIFGALDGIAGTVTLGTAVLSANIVFAPAGAGNYTITGGGNTLLLTNRTIVANSSATISADIAGGQLILAHSVGLNPGGTLTLSGNNSFTGGFVIGPNDGGINGGAPNTTAAVRAMSSSAFGTGAISFNGQGNATSPRLELAGGVTITNAVTFAGRNNVATGIESLAGANTLSGPLNPSPGGSQYPLRVDGSSTLAVAGTTTLQNSGPRNLVLSGSGNGTVSGPIVGGNAGLLSILVSKAGTGRWTLAGPNTAAVSYAISGGILALDYSTQNNSKLAAQSPLYLAGGVLELNGGAFTESVASNVVTAGESTITRPTGASVLRMNNVVRRGGGIVNFAAPGIADTTAANINGILGGFATVGGSDWAINSTGGPNGPVTAYAGYTDIAALGSTIANNTAANVRLNSAGAGGSIAIGAGTTTVNTLLQNTTTAATIDTAPGLLRLGSAGGVLVPSGRQGLTIGTAANAGILTAGGADNTAGEIILINHSANNLVINAQVQDNGSGMVGITKAGSGAATLNANNSHTGTNTIGGGTLNIASAANLGSGTVVINNGTLRATSTFDISNPVLVGPSAGYGNGTVDVAAGQAVNIHGVVANNVPANTGVSIAGSLTKVGAGTLGLTAANTYTYGTIVNEGVLSISSDANLGSFDSPSLNGAFTCYRPDNLVLNGGTLEIAGTFVLNANRGIRLGPINGSGSGTIRVVDGQTVNFNGQISDNWSGSGALVKTGNGILALGGGVSDFTGDTTVSAGTLQLDHPRALPNGPGKGNVVVSSGATLAIATNAMLNGLTGGGTLDNTTANPVRVTVGLNNASGAFTGPIQNTGGGALTLVKAGTGTLTLSSPAINHSGSTLVNGGTLALSGSAGLASSTNISIAAGATLNVSGLPGGVLTIGPDQAFFSSGTLQGGLASSAVLAPGGQGFAGVLNVGGNLTLNSGGILNFDVTSPAGFNDVINVTGNVALTPSTSVNVNFLGGLPVAGTYTLVQASGTISGNPGDLIPPQLGARYNVSFAIDNASSPRKVTMSISGNPQGLVWTGVTSADWDFSTLNWTNTGTLAADLFSQGDNVSFGNFGNNGSPINIVAPVLPGTVTVNSSLDYTFTTSGNGGISGIASLTKSGSGRLTLETQNDYSGATLINSGILQVGNAGLAGSLGTGPTTNNGALVFNRADDLTYTNRIAGSGSITNLGNSGTVVLSGPISGANVTVAGAGGLALGGSNSYTGPTTIELGILHARNAMALGTANEGTIVANGAQLFIDANVNIVDEALTISGVGPGNGAIRKGGAGVTTLGGEIRLALDSTIHLDGGSTLNLTNANGITGTNVGLTLAGDGGQGTITGPISLGTGSLTKAGAAVWTIAETNHFTGKTIINGGVLAVPTQTALGPVAGVTPDYVTLAGGSLGVTTNVVFSGMRGITAAGDGGFNVPAGATLTIASDITGSGNITKTGPGTLVLQGPKSFSGTLFADSNSTTANDGVTQITGNDAIANVPVTPGVPTILIRNNNGGFSTLELLPTASAGITIAQDVQVSSRNNTNVHIRSVMGSNVISGNILVQVGGADDWFQSSTGTLAISGNIDYVGTLAGARFYNFLGDGDILVTGNINASPLVDTTPLGSPISVRKLGPGTLTLAGANTYGGASADSTVLGTTIVSNGVLLVTGSISHNNGSPVQVAGGTLGGTGTINGDVTVGTGGNLSPGRGAMNIGTLNVNGNVSLTGTATIDINKSAGTRDQLSGVQTITYGGALVVNNLGGSYTLGDVFPVFNAAAHAGNFTSVTGSAGPGLAFGFNAANGTVTVIAGAATTPTNIQFSVSSGNLTLAWPQSHQGWVLQSQTNSLATGLSTNWADVLGSSGTNSVTMPITPSPAVFFRLRQP